MRVRISAIMFRQATLAGQVVNRFDSIQCFCVSISQSASLGRCTARDTRGRLEHLQKQKQQPASKIVLEIEVDAACRKSPRRAFS